MSTFLIPPWWIYRQTLSPLSLLLCAWGQTPESDQCWSLHPNPPHTPLLQSKHRSETERGREREMMLLMVMFKGLQGNIGTFANSFLVYLHSDTVAAPKDNHSLNWCRAWISTTRFCIDIIYELLSQWPQYLFEHLWGVSRKEDHEQPLMFIPGGSHNDVVLSVSTCYSHRIAWRGFSKYDNRNITVYLVSLLHDTM